ncbi:hypothetical protein ANO11243_032570 [Dothideomycetidae sp. 11243]|nr:hypothetical protein ANO11243_032570 [fungal sp. No.11243]
MLRSCRTPFKLAFVFLISVLILSIYFNTEEFIFDKAFNRKFHWRNVARKHPVDSYRPLPKGPAQRLPQIQFDFPKESEADREERQDRQNAVRSAFLHSWNGYKKHAWLQDEVSPISGGSQNGFGGWGATLVDALDTLWIMDLKDEFNNAAAALEHIDFSYSSIARISVFETNIRYLGGLLSAYDLSGRKYKSILRKAVEVGDMLYLAFDTANYMPVPHWFLESARAGGVQSEPSSACIAEYGTFSLEFTRLSQITGNPKYYDAMARVMDVFEAEQNRTKIPGLWPIWVRPQAMVFSSDTQFSLGAMADSMYEYLPKQHLLLRGRTDAYEKMYTSALEAAKENLFFQALTPNDTKIMFSGYTTGFSQDTLQHDSTTGHLTCFVGGMVGLGAKLFGKEQDLEIARQLTDGCIWAYDMMPSGIMPEQITVQRCGDSYASKLGGTGKYPNCTWSDEQWHQTIVDAHSSLRAPTKDVSLEDRARQQMQNNRLPKGFVSIPDRRYLLRPEAIESVFVMYRITGDRSFMDAGWRMFRAINEHTKTDIAHAGIKDVSVEHPEQEDKMESFWLGETLKYFYLLFSEPDLISLDDFVFNTEAHPLLVEKS